MASKSERTSVPNGPLIEECRKVAGLTVEALARKAKVSKDTVRRVEDGKCVFHKTIEAIALALDKNPFSVLVENEAEPSRPPCDVRDVSGRWLVTGEDIEVRGEFDYKTSPKSFSAKIQLTQQELANQVEVRGTGNDHDGDPVEFSGELVESSIYLRGEYTIRNPRMNIYGYVLLKYLNDGKSMRGHYLGRDTGHDSDFIIGKLRLTRGDITTME